MKCKTTQETQYDPKRCSSKLLELKSIWESDIGFPHNSALYQVAFAKMIWPLQKMNGNSIDPLELQRENNFQSCTRTFNKASQDFLKILSLLPEIQQPKVHLQMREFPNIQNSLIKIPSSKIMEGQDQKIIHQDQRLIKCRIHSTWITLRKGNALPQ